MNCFLWFFGDWLWSKLHKRFFVAFKIIQIDFLCEFLMRGSDDCWWTVLWILNPSSYLKTKTTKHKTLSFLHFIHKTWISSFGYFCIQNILRMKKITRLIIAKEFFKVFQLCLFPANCQSSASPLSCYNVEDLNKKYWHFHSTFVGI